MSDFVSEIQVLVNEFNMKNSKERSWLLKQIAELNIGVEKAEEKVKLLQEDIEAGKWLIQKHLEKLEELSK